MKRIYIIIVLSFVALCSLGFLFINKTSETVLNKQKYLSWVENESNDLKVSRHSEELSYEVTYCPISYLIAKEFRTENILQASYNEREKELKGLKYFKLRIKRKNSNEEVLTYNLEGGQPGYYKRVDYLSYGFDENLILVQNNFSDTLRPSLFHFERTYGVVPYIDFLVAFPDDSVKDNHLVFMLDDQIFGGGIIRFDFNNDKIKNSPKLLVK